MKKIFFTVTNDLTHDQRMQRICASLAKEGYAVTLVGRRLATSKPLNHPGYQQKRLYCFFKKGKLFYAEFNTRLFLFLLFKKMDAICAIDLDTILPCLGISRIKKIKRIYDAHELFTEMKEVISRPRIHKTWLQVERKAVPKFKYGYTVSRGIAEEFDRRYAVDYKVIRNLPVLRPILQKQRNKNTILYQGAVNEGRGFENLIPSMKLIHGELIICGEGNFMDKLKMLIRDNGVHEKVILRGMLSPDELWEEACQAYIGIHVPEKEGLNQLLALPNKFFDYFHAGLPQVTVNYPEYKKINEQFKTAILLNDTSPEKIAESVNNLIENDVLYNELQQNCLKAREELNWNKEEKKLIDFYHSVFAS
ncbi:MAG TPA: glycosyltransferase [Chitinophagaceae bacterium]|nr:glycosyltransferase [Chitinophagaceae bacterium]